MRSTLLNAKSDFSLLWGTRKPREVVERAAALGYEAVALADRDNLYGLPAFLTAARRHGVRPIVAAEVTDPVTRQSALLYPQNETGYANLCRILIERHCGEEWTRPVSLGNKYPTRTDVPQSPSTDVAQSPSTGISSGSRPRAAVPHERLDRTTQDATQRCHKGEFVSPTAKAAGHPREAVGYPREVRAQPGAQPEAQARAQPGAQAGAQAGTQPEAQPGAQHVGFDLHRALRRYADGLAVVTDSPELLEQLRAAGHTHTYVRIGHSLRRPPPEFRDLPAAIVPPAIFLDDEDVALHRLMRAIDCKQRLGTVPTDELADERSRLEPADKLLPRYAALPEAIDGTERLIDSLAFEPDFGQTLFPEFPTPPDMSVVELLRCKTYEGARRRYGTPSRAVVERIERELDLIEGKGFAAYFLVVDEIVRRSPRICGRGSAAASIVAYCLGITNVEPIRHNLFFERFLNPGRTDPPDIDVDFAWDERDDILEWVLNHYGTEHSAMVANHLHFRPRMALRETARVFGLPEREISAVTRRLPWCWQTDDESALDAVVRDAPRLGDVTLDPPWPEIIRLAGRLVGKPRGLSVHPGGVVLTPGPIWQRVPVQPSAKGVNIVHWEKDGVEDLGLVKIDLLGNRSLAVIRDAIANLREEGIDFDEFTWDAIGDAKTQRMLAAGRSMGVFYCESPAMRQLQRKTGCGDFEHLVINTSIIRPAANAYTTQYVERVRGVPYEPIHPLLAEILAETYGIMVYQEDVSRVAMAMAGFSCEDADRLRKIMSKKDRELELAHFYRKFVEGARARGVSDEAIDEVFKMILAFSGYSFCKPHSASYTKVTYQSAYLKAHHPAEFMAAVLGNHGGYYSTQAYVSEARRLGVEVLRPDVNLSEVKFVARGGRIVTGLGEIKGLSLAAQERVVTERRRSGAFGGLNDLLARTGIGYADAKRLILAGGLDRSEPSKNRPTLLWELKLAANNAASRNGEGRGEDEPSCFEQGSDSASERDPSCVPHHSLGVAHCFSRGGREFDGRFTSPSHDDLPPTPALRDYDRRRILELEYDRLGFLATAHPLEVFAPQAGEADHRTEPGTRRASRSGPVWIKADQLEGNVGRTVRILSWPISAKSITTVHGEHMEFVSFEDETALYEAVLFPRPYRKYANLLFCDFAVVVTGRVDDDFGAVSVIVDRIARA